MSCVDFKAILFFYFHQLSSCCAVMSINLKVSKNKNILPLLYIYIGYDCKTFVMATPYMDQGSLKDYLAKQKNGSNLPGLSLPKVII